MIKEQITEVVATKLVMYPKDKGLTEDKFDCDGTVKLIRLFYNSEFNCFKYIKIGDRTIDYGSTLSTAPLSKIVDIPIPYEFKKDDKFIIDSIYKIEKIELFI